MTFGAFDLFDDVSTVDTGTRSDFDFYETPAWMTRSLLHFHAAIRHRTVLECCSGRDAIVAILRAEAGCHVFTNDIDLRQPAQMHDDATRADYWRSAPRVEWIITNPPFEAAFDILRFAIEHASVGVAMVLGKNYSQPTEDRGLWLHEHPPTRTICQPRHSFRGTGSPPMASDWFIWEREPDRSLRPIEIDHVAKARSRMAA